MKHMKKRILACLLAGALTVSTFATAGAPVASAAGATLGYWPEPLPVANQFIPESNLSEVMRLVISNGIILYALAQAKGGSGRE